MTDDDFEAEQARIDAWKTAGLDTVGIQASLNGLREISARRAAFSAPPPPATDLLPTAPAEPREPLCVQIARNPAGMTITVTGVDKSDSAGEVNAAISLVALLAGDAAGYDSRAICRIADDYRWALPEMFRKEDDRRATAVHEAAHAVAAIAVGALVKLTVVPDDTSRGRCIKEWPHEAEDAKRRTEDNLVVTLAGPMAAFQFCTDSFFRQGVDFDDDKRRELELDFVKHNGSCDRRIYLRASSRARKIIEARRDDIERLAEALLDKKAMDGAEVLALLDRKA
jgi:hypothetical protein